MTSTDVTRLYALLDEARKETRVSLVELRGEVQGYRADLNGRLRALETSEAKRQGIDHGKGLIGRVIIGAASVGAATASVITLIIRLT